MFGLQTILHPFIKLQFVVSGYIVNSKCTCWDMRKSLHSKKHRRCFFSQAATLPEKVHRSMACGSQHAASVPAQIMLLRMRWQEERANRERRKKSIIAAIYIDDENDCANATNLPESHAAQEYAEKRRQHIPSGKTI